MRLACHDLAAISWCCDALSGSGPPSLTTVPLSSSAMRSAPRMRRHDFGGCRASLKANPKKGARDAVLGLGAAIAHGGECRQGVVSTCRLTEEVVQTTVARSAGAELKFWLRCGSSWHCGKARLLADQATRASLCDQRPTSKHGIAVTRSAETRPVPDGSVVLPCGTAHDPVWPNVRVARTSRINDQHLRLVPAKLYVYLDLNYKSSTFPHNSLRSGKFHLADSSMATILSRTAGPDKSSTSGGIRAFDFVEKNTFTLGVSSDFSL